MRTLIYAGFVLLAAGLCPAVTITVDDNGPADFNSIQAAVDYSWHGDTIVVSPGEYSEDVYFNGRSIVLTSSNPNDANVVQATSVKGNVYFNFNEGPLSVFTGFTVTCRQPSIVKEVAICTGTGNQEYPAIYDNLVVWQDTRNGNIDIYGKGLTSQVFAICTATGNQTVPAIDGDIVVWQDTRNGLTDIYGFDLLSGQEFVVYTGAGDQAAPSIYGNVVVWQDNRSGNWDIYGKDLTGGQEFGVCTATGTQSNPAVYGDIIVWQDSRNGNYDIYGKNLNSGEEFAVCTLAGEQSFPAIYEQTVVWQDYRNANYDIYGKYLTGGQDFAICTATGNQYFPVIYGKTVVWQDYRNSATSKYDIYSKNLTTTQESVICAAANNQSSPAIYGNTIVWNDLRTGNDVYGRFLVGSGGGIICNNSSPVIISNILFNWEFGILCVNGAMPSIESNVIKTNYYGIAGCAGDIENNDIVNNYTAGIYNCTGRVIDNKILFNDGVAIQNHAGDPNQHIIYQNEISGNGSGLLSCTGGIYGNVVSGNHGNGLSSCGGVMRDNTVVNNTGAGFHLCTGDIFNNVISGNNGGLSSCNAEIYTNTVFGNLSHGVTGGSQMLRENNISGNAGKGVSSFNGTVINNLVAGNLSDGINDSNSVVNNTVVENKGNGLLNCSGVVKANIIAFNAGYGIYGASQNSYNCLWQNTAGSFYNNYGKTGDFYANPLFAAAGSWTGDVWTAGDYSLRSQYGRWDEVLKQWVMDGQTSPCVDNGNPADWIGFEPNPNGGRINVGYDGGMAFASKGSSLGPDPNDPPVVLPVCVNKPSMDVTNDCRVDLADFAMFAGQWMACGYDKQEECW